MIKLMGDCPICVKITDGDIIVGGDHCCLIKWGDKKVAVLSHHAEGATADETAEAIKLLEFDTGRLILTNFDAVAGHWGLESIQAGEVAGIGTSKAGS